MRATGTAEQVERDRSLIPEEPEHVHLGERERHVHGPVEHREHAEHAVVDEERHRHDAARHVAGRLGGVAREAGVFRQIVDDEGLPGHEHPAGDAGTRGEALADERAGALPGDRFEDELIRRFVEQEHRRCLRMEDPARSLDRRLEQRSKRVVRAEDAGSDSCAQVAHAPPPTFVDVRCSTLFS